MTMMMLGLWCELKQEREQSEREGERRKPWAWNNVSKPSVDEFVNAAVVVWWYRCNYGCVHATEKQVTQHAISVITILLVYF